MRAGSRLPAAFRWMPPRRRFVMPGLAALLRRARYFPLLHLRRALHLRGALLCLRLRITLLLLRVLFAHALLRLRLRSALLLRLLLAHALLCLRLRITLLLHLLFAHALLCLRLRSALLLHLLFAHALLCLHLRVTLLLRLLLAHALLCLYLRVALRLGLLRPLGLHSPWLLPWRLFDAFDRLHHGQSAGSRRRALGLAGALDHWRVRQSCGPLTRMREARGRQLVGA